MTKSSQLLLQLIFLFSRSITARSPLIVSGMNANAEVPLTLVIWVMGFRGAVFFVLEFLGDGILPQDPRFLIVCRVKSISGLCIM